MLTPLLFVDGLLLLVTVLLTVILLLVLLALALGGADAALLRVTLVLEDAILFGAVYAWLLLRRTQNTTHKPNITGN